jgi:hypothetical protein
MKGKDQTLNIAGALRVRPLPALFRVGARVPVPRSRPLSRSFSLPPPGVDGRRSRPVRRLPDTLPGAKLDEERGRIEGEVKRENV